MSAPEQKRRYQLATAGWDFLCAAVAAGRALLPVLPFLLRVALRGAWTGFRLSLAGTECAVCRVPFSRKHVFRLHREAGWVCSDCHSLFDHGTRALVRNELVHAGIAPGEESAA